ncbi:MULTISPECIES: hypothetical protein [Alkalihalophilus]|uniref:Uncharacterized protein n=1 Tax=Alkalihalophilus pseudofirmus (strain ATCC BAA-2126 / JCM 17055 / OF4) TaxID=398511 RepID=D3G1K4_ALKPO|nr:MULTISPECIES: hypothetical protein [Alkalihalophilus]ADC52230.1 hypothetical protein BpOF4_21174 [Alkalihalophilus pseudofirmus OF4]MEC2074360.1 hypothetical protein [Alkalihalophilus marmarensis]
MSIKPDLHNLNQLDAAVLHEKYHLLNAMLVRGTKEEKQRAKRELEKLDTTINQTVNLHAVAVALHHLRLKPDELREYSDFRFN